MTTYFDYLPLEDVIHESIFPYLDYESRIQFNRALPPIERFGRRLGAQAVLAHDIHIQCLNMKSQLRYITNAGFPKQKRCQKLVMLLTECRPIGRYSSILKHCASERQALINKCLEIAERPDDVLHVTPYFKKKIQRVASEVLSDILEMKTGSPIKPIQIL